MSQPLFSSSDEYFDFATKLYDLIMTQMENIHPNHLSSIYPKLVVMYEFFRLIRGEAFLDFRPIDPERQSRLYAMEDGMCKRLSTIQQQLDTDDPSLRFHIDEMKSSFDFKK